MMNGKIKNLVSLFKESGKLTHKGLLKILSQVKPDEIELGVDEKNKPTITIKYNVIHKEF